MLSRFLVRASGPVPGTPAARVQEAYITMGQATRRGDLEGRNDAYQALAEAAEQGNLQEVIAAVIAIDASLEISDVAFRTAVHQLTIAVYNLKHLR